MQHLHEQYPDLVVLVVNSDEPIKVARPYYQERMVTITIALDESGVVSDAYHTYAIPTVLFIDAEGIIRQVNVGAPGNQALQVGLKAIGVR